MESSPEVLVLVLVADEVLVEDESLDEVLLVVGESVVVAAAGDVLLNEVVVVTAVTGEGVVLAPEVPATPDEAPI